MSNNKSINLVDIKVGMSVSYSQTIEDKHIRQFADVSGDHNPVHLDEKYAVNTRFKRRIAHGLMSGSFFSGLFGTKLPGPGCVYTAQSFSFKRPVYIGDTVTATATVKSVNVDTRRVLFETVCKVRSKTVIDGTAELYVP